MGKTKKRTRSSFLKPSSSGAIGDNGDRLRQLEGLPETGEEDSVLGQLSDDSILQILCSLHTRFLLSSPALVCRRWRRLIQTHLVLELLPSPLTAYDLLPWGSLGDEDLQDLVRQHSSTLERVTLCGPKKLTGNDIASILKSLPRLKDFGLVSSPFTDVDLELIVDALPTQLTRFDLHNDHLLCRSCDDNSTPLALSGFTQDICKKCPNLKYLDLGLPSYINKDAFDNLLLTIPHLLSIHLQSSTIGWPEVSRMLQSFASLESISIVSSSLIEEQNSSDDDDGTPKRGYWFRRQISHCQNNSLGSLVNPSLRSIRFYSSPHRSVPLDSTPVFGLLKEKGQQLRYLHAQSLYNTSWHTISVWCANLKTLDLSHARAIQYSPTEIEELVLSGLPRLLKGVERIALPSVTDHILSELGRFCTKLKELHFEGYASTSVMIPTQRKVTDRGVLALAEGCPNLQVISLAGCTSISVSSLRAIVFHCRSLKVLMLTGCLKINDDAIAAVWPRLGKHLVVLDVVGCKITGKTPRLFYQQAQVNGTSLTVLEISRSLHKSARREISELEKAVPSLRIISSTSGMAWDGFFGSYSFDEVLPKINVTNKF